MRRLVVGGVSAVTMAGVGVVGLSGSAGATSTFSISRLSGPSRFSTAAAIAAAAYPKGAATVILASGLEANISDSLASSYLAGQLNGGAGAPILLTNPNAVPAETTAALKSLGTTNIIVVGGSAAVSDSVVTTLSKTYTVTRVSGANRFLTAAAIDSVSGDMTVGTAGGAKASGPSTPTSNGVTLNTTSAQPGGTVSGTLANPTTVKTLTLGGIGSSTQTLTVNQTTGSFSFTVPAGQASGAITLVFTTTPTNGAAATQGTTVLTVNPANGNTYTGQRFAIVADGQDANLVDSLGAAPVAFAEHFPILLVNGPTGTLSAAQLAFLKSNGVSSDVLIVGGSGAVGSQVATQITANGQTPVNVAGTNRSGTSEALAEFAINNLGFSTSTFDIASGAPGHLIDSLSGGPYGGTRTPPAPTLITTDVNNPGSVPDFATKYSGTETSAVVFGGSAAVSDASIALITTAGQAAGAPGSVSLITSTVPIGGTITGTVSTPALVKSLTVSGCGLSSAPVNVNSSGGFAVSIPASQAAGTCTLTFTATLTNGTTVTSTESVTVTGTSVNNTGFGTPPTAGESAPVLIGATITANNFGKAANSTVQFTFSGPVTAQVAHDFSLAGYDTERAVAATAATTDGSNPNVVDANFSPFVDVASYTFAVAENTGNGAGASAARGSSGTDAGKNNPLGSVSLSGSSGPASTTSGLTTGPNLLSAAVNPANLKEVTYTFDKPVGAAVAADFGVGRNTKGVAFDPTYLPGTTTVPVDFAANQSGATRFWVLEEGAFGTGGPNATESVGSPSDLVSVTPVAGNDFQYDFTFNSSNTSVTAGPAADFVLYTNDGTEYVGQHVVATLTNNTVRVDFSPGLTEMAVANLTLGTVEHGAVTLNPSGNKSGVGSEPISGLVTSGNATDGPQLQSASTVPGTNTVTYTFNQPVFFNVSGGFFVIDAAGKPKFATGVADQGNTEVVTFAPAALATAVGAGVTADGYGFEGGGHLDATTNIQGFANPPGDVTLTS
ncbi:MAG: cell wall-binding repeat-containing protein [Acidimicrobiales bacterium]